jgi:hypothetical protein
MSELGPLLMLLQFDLHELQGVCDSSRASETTRTKSTWASCLLRRFSRTCRILVTARVPVEISLERTGSHNSPAHNQHRASGRAMATQIAAAYLNSGKSRSQSEWQR